MSNGLPLRVLILGATGMLGHVVLRYFCHRQFHLTTGTVRSSVGLNLLSPALRKHVIAGVDVEDFANLAALFASARPQVVINCVGVVKQLAAADNPLTAIPINSLLPHRLAQLCGTIQARLLHVSTDCVFCGRRGMYSETDVPDANDLYGRSKLLGEVDYPNAVTLRTSIIGPELSKPAHGLLGWFLAQRGSVRGFTKAVFSGLSTVELSRVMHDFVIPNEELHGVFHVSAAPIDKYSLLRLFAQEYGLATNITPDNNLIIDRSLDSRHFREATGYSPPSWIEIVEFMRKFG